MIIRANEFHLREFLEAALLAFGEIPEKEILRKAINELKLYDRSLIKLVRTTLLPQKFKNLEPRLTDLTDFVHLNSFLQFTCSLSVKKQYFLERFDHKIVCGDDFVKLPDEVIEAIKNNKVFYYVSRGGKDAKRNARKHLEQAQKIWGDDGVSLVEIPFKDISAFYLVY